MGIPQSFYEIFVIFIVILIAVVLLAANWPWKKKQPAARGKSQRSDQIIPFITFEHLCAFLLLMPYAERDMYIRLLVKEMYGGRYHLHENRLAKKSAQEVAGRYRTDNAMASKAIEQVNSLYGVDGGKTLMPFSMAASAPAPERE